MQRYKNSIVLLIVILIVIAGGIVWYKKYNDGNTHERVKISQINLEKKKGLEQVPEQLPKELPLQLSEVEESFTMSYPERNVVVSGITYLTYKTPEEIFNEYETYLDANKFILNANTLRDKGTIGADKDGNTLLIVISYLDDVNSQRRVQIVYTQNNSQK